MILKEGKAMREIESKRAKERQGTRTDIVENLPPCDFGKTRDKVAETLDISGKQLEKLELIEKHNPQALKKIDAGVSTVHREFKKIKFNEAIKTISKSITPEGVYDVIVIDPPWNYGTKYDPETRRVSCLFCAGA